MNAPTHLVSLSVAARRLHVSAKWLAEETASGRLPGLKAGEKYLYDWRALSFAILNRAQKTSKPPSIRAHGQPKGGKA
jgi:hypothetical protein